MDGLALNVVALAVAGSTAGLGLTRAAGALTPFARTIDLRRPWVGAAAALWGAGTPLAIVLVAGPEWLAPAALFCWAGLAIALADLGALRAPHWFSAAAGLAGLACAALWAPERAPAALLTGLGAFVLLAAARRAFRDARGRDGLGGGDAGVMAALAVWAGPWGAPSVLGLGALLALGLAAVGRGASGRVPLASCLVAASVVVAVGAGALFGVPFWTTGWEP